jgi:transposase
MKFIAPISNEIKQTLEEMRYHHPSLHYRLRAEAILLNSRGFSVPKISQVIEYERKAICRWLDNWQKLGLIGLYDKPRSGRPSILSAQDVTLVEELDKEEPRQLKQALAKFEKITGKKASCYTLKRVLKNANILGNVAAAH